MKACHTCTHLFFSKRIPTELALHGEGMDCTLVYKYIYHDGFDTRET